MKSGTCDLEVPSGFRVLGIRSIRIVGRRCGRPFRVLGLCRGIWAVAGRKADAEPQERWGLVMVIMVHEGTWTGRTKYSIFSWGDK